MFNFLSRLFDSSGFLPHRHCFLDEHSVVLLHVASDAVIASTYYSIPAMLLYFTYRRRDIPFHWMFLMFGAFIFLCGTTHVFAIYTLWVPTYRIEGVIKLLTALASLGTAVALFGLIPKALVIPSMAAKKKELEETTEELVRSNADLEQFAYVASHDLKEPLRIIIGYAQLLERRYKDRLDENANEYIDFMVQAVDRMGQLIDDLLEYSRVGKPAGGVGVVDTNDSIQRALDSLRTSISESEAEISFVDLPSVRANSFHVSQLFQNLISNALKFRGTDGPKIRISAERQGNFWQFKVEDNGIGFESEYTEKIFIIFQRLHSSSEYSGSGIGLALCKRIVEYYRGRIWAEGALGKGAAFFFTLPAP